MWKKEDLDWKKQIQIAERLISAGRLSKAADALDQALQLAKASKNVRREFETLIIISVVQLQSNSIALPVTTQRALELAEKHTGAESGFTARALLMRSCVKEICLTEDADIMIERAAKIFKAEGELDQLVHRLDYLVYSQILANNFKQALATLKRGLKYSKECYGDTSTQVELLFHLYADLMIKLGKEHELPRALRTNFPEVIEQYERYDPGVLNAIDALGGSPSRTPRGS